MVEPDGKSKNGLKLFICYSHSDEAHKDKLLKQLSGIQRQGLIDAWHDRKITAGDDWREDIDQELEDCDLGLLLVSDNFLDSEFINSVELKRLMQRESGKQARVVPIILSHCLWKFEAFGSLQVLPRDGAPIVTFSEDNGDRDLAWKEIAENIAGWAAADKPKAQVPDQEESLPQPGPESGDKKDPAKPLIKEKSIERVSKVVRTCVFSKLRGLRKCIDQMGEERVGELINAYHDAVEAMVDDNACGHVQKYADVEIILTYKNPSDAISASLQMQAIARKLSPSAEVQISASIGLHQGEILVYSDEQAKLIGRHMNSASQVCSAADPGQILVTATAYEGRGAADHYQSEAGLVWRNFGFFNLPSCGPMELYEIADQRHRTPALPSTLAGEGRPASVRKLELFGYKIEERIGAGGFGIVYKANHVDQGKPVALKMLSDHSALTAEVREQFANEIAAIKKLDHESMVKVLDVHEDGAPAFYVMEWVDGLPINKALDNSDWSEKAKVLSKVCDSLNHAHENSIVHADIKPNNILLDQKLSPKILDFGLSRVLTEHSEVSGQSKSRLAGTAHYLSPEQIRPPHDIGVQSDVYALGIVMYELLVGKPPFAATGFHQVLEAHLHEAPELPILQNSDVPEPLQRICLKALEKAPAERYQSMREMQIDLDKHIRGEKIDVRPGYYNNLIESPARGHLTAIKRWRKRELITDEENVRLHRAYNKLTRTGLSAVGESRMVHFEVVATYLTAWLVLAGASLWLALEYLPDDATTGFGESWQGRVLISFIPVLVMHWLWRFFAKMGSYRYAIAAMTIGMMSVPFVSGVLIHEVADTYEISKLQTPINLQTCPLQESLADQAASTELTVVSECLNEDQLFGDEARIPNTQLFFALIFAVLWSIYVALRSRTMASVVILVAQSIALYLVVLDFWGLNYLFSDYVSKGGLLLLPASLLLLGAGYCFAEPLKRRRQSVPLIATAMILAVFASQLVAITGPSDWEWDDLMIWIGLFEVGLGVLYLLIAVFLRSRYRIDAATAHIALMWLAPVALLLGLSLMDIGWMSNSELWTLSFYGKEIGPWILVLIIASICVAFFSAKIQSGFYVLCGLIFLAYGLASVALYEPRSWGFPFTVLLLGLVTVSWLAWRDKLSRTGEDIDDLGERLIEAGRTAKNVD